MQALLKVKGWENSHKGRNIARKADSLRKWMEASSSGPEINILALQIAISTVKTKVICD